MSTPRAQMADYVKGCAACEGEWIWSSTDESDREVMAGWIALDLDIGDEDDFGTALDLCRAAGWP